jgi:murein L,D-transpeptidase YafK
MEEVYALMREAFEGGQTVIHVHALPFRMTKANMARYAKSEWAGFWRTLKQGYDYFELTRQLPTIAVCNRRYVVNVKMSSGDPTKLNPAAACPPFLRPKPSPFTPKPDDQRADAERAVAPGPKMRSAPSTKQPEAPMMGLTGSPQSISRAISDWWQSLKPSLGLDDKSGK